MRLFAYQFCGDSHWLEVLATQNISVEQHYRDTLAERPVLQMLLEDCRTSPPDYVLTESATALAGDSTTLQIHLQRFWDCAVGVIALGLNPRQNEQHEPVLLAPLEWSSPVPQLGNNPPIRALTPQEWIELGADLETHQKRLTIQQGHGRNRLQGLPPPGQAPYGYRRGKTSYLIDRRAAPVVKGFYEHFLLYGSLRSAVRFVARTYGKTISPSTGKRWLTHPVYRGHLCYHETDIIANAHPALLSDLEAAQVDRLLRRNQRFSTRAASAPRSLSGLVHCTMCGSGMTVSQVTRPHRQYLYLRPQHCPHRPKCSGLAYDQVLERTIATICDRLPQAVKALTPPQLNPKEALIAQITAQEKVLAQIPDLLETGVLDEETAQLRMFKLQTELSQLKEQLSSLPPVNLQETIQAIAIPEFWQDLSETERRFYLREFIRSINITRRGKDWDLALDFVFTQAEESPK